MTVVVSDVVDVVRVLVACDKYSSLTTNNHTGINQSIHNVSFPSQLVQVLQSLSYPCESL